MTTCPKCNSHDIEEEDDAMTNLLLLGVPIPMNTDYRCRDCGYKWSD